MRHQLPNMADDYEGMPDAGPFARQNSPRRPCLALKAVDREARLHRRVSDQPLRDPGKSQGTPSITQEAIVDPLNVSQFLAAYNVSLANVLELKVSTITGILEPKNNTIYRGEVYWVLVDGGARLTVRIPERYRHLRGRRVEVTGQPYRQTNEDRGEIEVILRVQRIVPLDPTPEDWIGPLRPIGEQRRSSWPAIERFIESRILAGGQPHMLMLFGTSSSVDRDVRAALGQHAQAYHIDERRIPLTNPAAVAAALSVQEVDADLVAIVRGGGEGISALSDRQVIEAVAHHVQTWPRRSLRWWGMKPTHQRSGEGNTRREGYCRCDISAAFYHPGACWASIPHLG
jgi:hypothetical protein